MFRPGSDKAYEEPLPLTDLERLYTKEKVKNPEKTIWKLKRTKKNAWIGLSGISAWNQITTPSKW